MEKTKVILVLPKKNFLRSVLPILDYERILPVAVLADDGDEKFITINGKIKFQTLPFSFVRQLVEIGQNFLWLICGGTNLDQMKKFLAMNGVPEKNIVNLAFAERINPAWLGNLRLVEGDANCFATGDEFTVRGLDFKQIPDVNGVNLAATGQDLRQSFQVARHVFARKKSGAIKFAFIGLTPYSLLVDNRKIFSACADEFVYALALGGNFRAQTDHDKFLVGVLSKAVGKIFAVTPEQADPNFDKLRATFNQKISFDAITDRQNELTRRTKIFDAATVEENLRVLENYVKLCVDNGAKPVAILFPFAEAVHEDYPRENLMLLQSELRRLEKIHGLTVIDMFDAQTDYDSFSDTVHLNLRGAEISSTAIDFRLRGKNLLPHEKISRLNYEQIFDVSNFLPKDDFNAAIDRHFAAVAKNLRVKRKIRVGFVSDDPSMWCGDKLFNLFAHNKRCETTFFLCLQKSFRGQETMLADFQRGFDGFKSRGINVVAITTDEQTVPAQDVLIMLRPYFQYLPRAFELSSISAQTLMAYIPYGFNTSTWNIYDTPIYHLGWKLFFDTQFHINLLEEKCRTGMPRGIYSGYTKLDAFYENPDALTFDWKMTRPDAKKIIWAPHWSISSGIFYATFQWNYKFMYEFAKAHPEISWVVKPHPMLFASAVGHGVFPNDAAFNAYLDAWNNLPNAKVFSGPYYQGLFATSDGMIMDCGSWIGEYQYTHKPMIFLTRPTQQFNELGENLMKVLYRVDGRNLQGIAQLMQKIFIDGKDDMFAARMKFFDEHMNYFQTNKMTAAEFIFRTVAKELRL